MAKHSVEDFDREHRNHVRVRYDEHGKPYKWDALWVTITFRPAGGLQTIPAIAGPPPLRIGDKR